MIKYSWLSLALLSLLVCACNSRSLTDEGGIGGTGKEISGTQVAGVVTDDVLFRVNGVHYDTTDAVVMRNGSVVEGQTDDFFVGEYVRVSLEGDTTTVSELNYTAQVIGPVTQLAAEDNRVEVLGQSVLLTELAVIRGYSSISEMAVGDRLEVSGYRVDGDLTRATSITHDLGATLNDSVAIQGEIDELVDNTTVRINNLEVDVQNVISEGMVDGQPLMVGNTLYFKGVSGSTALHFVATSAVRVSNAPSINNKIKLSGSATNYVSLNEQFNVNSVATVVRSNTILDNGTRPTFAVSEILPGDPDPLLEIDEITVAGSINYDSILAATYIEYTDPLHKIDIDGMVSSINLNERLLYVDGIACEITDSTIFFDGRTTGQSKLSFDQLKLGDRVEVQAKNGRASNLLARKVNRVE